MVRTSVVRASRLRADVMAPVSHRFLCECVHNGQGLLHTWVSRFGHFYNTKPGRPHRPFPHPGEVAHVHVITRSPWRAPSVAPLG